jgi:peptide/nickel transport system permease protein
MANLRLPSQLRAPSKPRSGGSSSFRGESRRVQAVLLVVILFLALFAPVISATRIRTTWPSSTMDSRLPPGSKAPWGTFWLGTDDQGRDMLSAILYGLRISLGVGVAATALALVIGLAAGLPAAYVGGRIEAIIMRVVDIQLSFPAILIALILIAVLGQASGTALVTVRWAYYTDVRSARSGSGVRRGRALPRVVACADRLPSAAASAPMIVVATVRSRRRSRQATLSFWASGCPSPSLRSAC